jgi:regulator of sigma E protease
MYGVPAMPTPIVGAMKADGATAQAGIKPGDRIVAFNGTENPTWRNIEVDAALRPGQEIPIVVERAGQRIPLTVTPSKVEMSGQNFGVLDAEPDAGVKPVVIGQVESGSPAAEAGLQSGDRVIAINGTNIRNWQQLVSFVQENKAAPLKVQVERGGQNVDLTATVRKLSDGKERLGIGPAQISVPREPASIGTAMSHAVNTNLEILSMTGTALGQVFTGNRSARDTVSGPVGIFQQSAQAAQAMGWEGIFAMLMAISLSLGIFNLLPIPMLDGGQIMVLGIEGVLALFGKQLSLLVRERIQMAGLAIILLLMVTVMFVDISRIVGR